MDSERRIYLLRGIDEYCRNRKNMLQEDINREIIEINGIKMTKISGSFEEYAKKNNLINANDIIWSK